MAHVQDGSTRHPRRRAFARAVRDGDLEAVRALAQRDPGLVDAGNAHGNRPLGEAVRAGHLAVFELLLDLGAELHARNHGGSSVLDGVATVETRAFYDVVVARGVEPTRHQAAGADDVVRLAALLDAGDSSAGRRPGQTPLHTAVLGGAPAAVVMLVQRGWDVEARMDWHDGPHYTPLAMLARCPRRAARPPIAATLLDAGADVDAPSGTFGGTLLLEAIAQGDRDLAALLLERGADPNLRDDGGSSALHKAVSRGPLAMIDLVLQYRPDLSLRTSSGPTQPGGETALAYARRLGKRSAASRIEAAGGCE